MSARLLYVMDPMCSWCWGFAPVAKARNMPHPIGYNYKQSSTEA